MRVIQKGHVYELSTKLGSTVTLTYFKDLPHGDKDNHDGVLCQEVIRSLIDRYIDLCEQVPCEETLKIIVRLRECLIDAEKRAFGRTLEKSYAKSGKHVEQLPVHSNGHLFDIRSEQTQPQGANHDG